MNKSEVYRSPPSKVTLFDQNLPRSPVTDLKIDPQTYNVIAKYSERLQMSEKKSNKIERPIQKNYLNIEKYIKE